MDIKEKIKEKPYWDTSEYEYYTKGYRKLLGIPGRVLQGREVSSLSVYPLYMLKDLLSIHYKDLDIIEKISNLSLPKITSENISIINFQTGEVIDENVFTQLVDKANLLKTKIDDSRAKTLLFIGKTDEIDAVVLEARNFIDNFKNTFKAEIENKINVFKGDMNNFFNYISSISNPATINNLFVDVLESEVIINNTKANITKNEVFISELNKIVKNFSNENKLNTFNIKWTTAKPIIINKKSQLDTKYDTIVVNIGVLDGKINNAKIAIENNVTNAPEDTLPEVIELYQFFTQFSNEANLYIDEVTEIDNELVELTNEINSLKTSITG